MFWEILKEITGKTSGVSEKEKNTFNKVIDKIVPLLTYVGGGTTVNNAGSADDAELIEKAKIPKAPGYHSFEGDTNAVSTYGAWKWDEGDNMISDGNIYADNAGVNAMLNLLRRGSYNTGRRETK